MLPRANAPPTPVALDRDEPIRAAAKPLEDSHNLNACGRVQARAQAGRGSPGRRTWNRVAGFAVPRGKTVRVRAVTGAGEPRAPQRELGVVPGRVPARIRHGRRDDKNASDNGKHARPARHHQTRRRNGQRVRQRDTRARACRSL